MCNVYLYVKLLKKFEIEIYFIFLNIGFILPTDDEESYLNYSSIAEINSGKKTRFKELQRRNSIVPPHMRSSYATEVQCMSPYDKGLFDLVKHPLTNNDSSVKRNLFSVKKVKPSMLTSAKKKVSIYPFGAYKKKEWNKFCINFNSES